MHKNVTTIGVIDNPRPTMSRSAYDRAVHVIPGLVGEFSATLRYSPYTLFCGLASMRFSPRRPQKRHRLSSSGSSPAGSSTDAGGAALIAPAGGWDRPKELSRVGTPYGGWYRAAGSSTAVATGVAGRAISDTGTAVPVQL